MNNDLREGEDEDQVEIEDEDEDEVNVETGLFETEYFLILNNPVL